MAGDTQYSDSERRIALAGYNPRKPTRGRYKYTAKQAARMIGRTVESVNVFRYRNTLPEDQALEPQPELFAVPLDDIPKIRLKGDCMVVGDLQAPSVDYNFALLPALLAAKYLEPPRRLIMAGDMLNADWASKYPTVIQLPTWEQERAALEQMFAEWLAVFDEMYWIRGNHEDRLHRHTQGHFGMKELVNLVAGPTLLRAAPDYRDRIAVTEWGHIVVETETGEWRITHADGYSKNQLYVTQDLADKYQQHIINHHQHHLAQGWSRNGKYVIVDNGGLFDQEKLAFAVATDNKKPTMKNGFTMLKNGTAHLFGKPPFTDWGVWL